MNNDHITITPQSTIYICKTPLENDYKNQLTFSNLETQLQYFQSTIQKSFSEYTYIKKDNVVNVGINIDEIINCNYLFYTNTGFTNKTYYCFITNMQYVNENCTKITFETDCFQTYQFDIVYVNTFIEREHVTDDTLGKNTVPETLECGDYVINAHLRDSHLSNANLSLVVASAVVPSDMVTLYGGNFNGIYSGIRYYTYSASNMTTALQHMADNNKQDAVSSLFVAPDFLLTNVGGVVTNSTTPATYDLGVSPIATLNGYSPRNNKLLCYPFSYLLATNGNGQHAIYKQELFTEKNLSNEYVFRVYGVLTPGCSIRMIPINYDGTELNSDAGINLGKFPQCNWVTDMYTNWVTMNGVNVMTQAVTSAVSLGTAIATENVQGTINGVAQVTNVLDEVRKAELIPPQIYGNVNCGDVVTSSGNNTFHLYRMTIKQEMARIIDNYFDMFGYKINRVKTPNIHTRSNWNFVKTIDCNLEGDIPQTDLNILKQMFNNGVTFWHDSTKMYDYSQTNSILT